MSEVTITVGEDGPHFLAGDIRLIEDDGRELELPYDVQLHGRGHSENQPFCDLTHAAIDFDETLAN